MGFFCAGNVAQAPPLRCSASSAQESYLRTWPMLPHGSGQTCAGCCSLQSICDPLDGRACAEGMTGAVKVFTCCAEPGQANQRCPGAVQSLSRRGLHATALEVAKLSLVLDWRDPMDLTQVIDYYALRARNYGFVEVGCWPRRLQAGLAHMPCTRALWLCLCSCCQQAAPCTFNPDP